MATAAARTPAPAARSEREAVLRLMPLLPALPTASQGGEALLRLFR